MQKASVVVLPEFLMAAHCLEKHVKAKLVKVLFLLSQDHRHPGLQCKRVKGSRSEVFECRVDKRVRLIYDIAAGMLRCRYVGDHDDALKRAEKAAALDSGVMVDDVEIGDHRAFGCERRSDEDTKQYRLSLTDFLMQIGLSVDDMDEGET